MSYLKKDKVMEWKCEVVHAYTAQEACTELIEVMVARDYLPKEFLKFIPKHFQNEE